MGQAVLRGVVFALAVSGAAACGSDDSTGGGATGGTGGGSTGGTGGGSTGGTGGSGTGGATGGVGGGTGGSAGESPCTMTWTGAATGTADCTDSASSKFIGIKTAATVSWAASGDTTEYKVNFGFHLAKPPTATTYDGTTADDQFCTANITSTDFLSVWSADSKAPAGGSTCSITLTSVVDETGGGASSEFVVHGTATATLLKGSDASTVTLSVTF